MKKLTKLIASILASTVLFSCGAFGKEGDLEKVSYTTKDYLGDGAEITKEAYVYLPYNYDKSKKYNVIYLMHGIQGSIEEWTHYKDSAFLDIMDNLVARNKVAPFIVVIPNGRSSKNY